MCKNLLIIIFLFSFFQNWSQEKGFIMPDSLRSESFWNLQNKVYDYLGKGKIEKARFYSNAYLFNGYKKNDSLYIAEGYLFLASSIKNVDDQLNLLNKSIAFSMGKPEFLVPCMAYSVKAGIFDDKNNHKKALDNYLLALSSANKGGNRMISLLMKENISIIKSSIGEYQEALKYSTELWDQIKEEDSTDQYFEMIFSMSYRHAHLKNIDSAKYYNSLGLEKASKYNKPIKTNKFVFLEGLVYYYEADYQNSLIKLIESLKNFEELNDRLSLASTYYYIGNSYYKVDNKQEAIRYLKKMDSIFIEQDLLLPYCRQGYQILISYYKEKEDIMEQLHYTNRLVTIDSLINTNYKSLSKIIYEKFETPNSLNERDSIIKNLKSSENKIKIYIYCLIFIILISISALTYNYYKRKNDSKNFKKIIDEIKFKKDSKIEKTKENNIEIDRELVIKIISDLEKFELDNDFLNSTVSLGGLAKKFNTNHRYLSNIVNQSKNKSFSNYINDLRIDYVIDKLKEDNYLRKFSIEAIANEVGFRTSRAFSTAFKKKTGVNPSYFISKLGKS